MILFCLYSQVCVEECPSENEVGVRNNPVCVDSVDTSEFTNIEGDLFVQAVSNGIHLFIVLYFLGKISQLL